MKKEIRMNELSQTDSRVGRSDQPTIAASTKTAVMDSDSNISNIYYQGNNKDLGSNNNNTSRNSEPVIVAIVTNCLSSHDKCTSIESKLEDIDRQIKELKNIL